MSDYHRAYYQRHARNFQPANLVRCHVCERMAPRANVIWFGAMGKQLIACSNTCAQRGKQQKKAS